MLTDTLYTICVRQEAGYCGIGKVLFLRKNFKNVSKLAESSDNLFSRNCPFGVIFAQITQLAKPGDISFVELLL